MAKPTDIRTIEDITNRIVEVDNFLNDLQDDDDVLTPQAENLLVQHRKELDTILKFFNAEG